MTRPTGAGGGANRGSGDGEVVEGGLPGHGLDLKGFAVTAAFELAVTLGSFVADSAVREAGVTMALMLQPSWTAAGVGPLDADLTVALRLRGYVPLVDNAGSWGAEPNQPRLEDLMLSVGAPALLADDALGLSLGVRGEVTLPASVWSQHVTRVLGLGLRVSGGWQPVDWLAFDARGGASRFFNRLSQPEIAQGDYDRPPLTRLGGADALGGGMVATGARPTAWMVEWGAGAAATLPAGFAVTVDFTMLHFLSDSVDQANDGLSSPYARPGVGQTDRMIGVLEVSWQPWSMVSVALGTVVDQTPFAPDNRTPRFPWWDVTNGTLNRQVVYVAVMGSL